MDRKAVLLLIALGLAVCGVLVQVSGNTSGATLLGIGAVFVGFEALFPRGK